MSGQINDTDLGVSVEHGWKQADTFAIQDHCPSLAATIQKARAASLFGYVLVEASEVDVFSICGAEKPNYEDDPNNWLPMFLVRVAHISVGDLFATVWLHPELSKLPHAAGALAMLLGEAPPDFSGALFAIDFISLCKAVEHLHLMEPERERFSFSSELIK